MNDTLIQRSSNPSPSSTGPMGPRMTRSNKVFSPWDLCHLSPAFDFDRLVQEKIQRDAELGDDVDEDPPLDADADRTEAAGRPSEIPPPHPAAAPSAPPPPVPTPQGDGRHDSPPLPRPSSSTTPTTPDHQPAKPPPRNGKKRKADDPQNGEQKKKKKKTKAAEDPPSNHQKRRNVSSHAARAKKRANPAFGNAAPRQSIQERYADGGRDTIGCSFSLGEKKVSSTGFVGLHDDDGTRTVRPLEYFVGKDSKLKFTLQHWDGITPTLLVDKNGRVVGVLAGHPDEPRWSELHDEATKAMEAARPICDPHEKRPGRRGPFVSVRCGVSHGGGQKEPTNMNNSVEHEKVVEELNKLEFFDRVSSFSSSVMATRAPRLYEYYSTKIGRLYAHHPRLKRYFRGSIFCGTTYNLGPRTICFKHRDGNNLAFGWCAITSAGDFDPTAGGHLVLWECGLVIEFPPGSTILIPSAVIAHSNTAIQPDEQRYSFTQYTAGALFRWVENDFQSATAYRQSLTTEAAEKVKAADANRWEMGVSLLPTVPEKLDVVT